MVASKRAPAPRPVFSSVVMLVAPFLSHNLSGWLKNFCDILSSFQTSRAYSQSLRRCIQVSSSSLQPGQAEDNDKCLRVLSLLVYRLLWHIIHTKDFIFSGQAEAGENYPFALNLHVNPSDVELLIEIGMARSSRIISWDWLLPSWVSAVFTSHPRNPTRNLCSFCLSSRKSVQIVHGVNRDEDITDLTKTVLPAKDKEFAFHEVSLALILSRI